MKKNVETISIRGFAGLCGKPDFGVDMRVFTMRNASQKFIDIKI